MAECFRQQAITFVSVCLDLCLYIVSLGHYDLKSNFIYMIKDRKITHNFDFWGYVINLCVFIAHFVCYSTPWMLEPL